MNDVETNTWIEKKITDTRSKERHQEINIRFRHSKVELKTITK